MKRNAFGDPQPLGFEELMEVLFEKEWEPSQCYVGVEFLEEEAPFGGWTAEIAGDNDIVSTLGYADKSELMKDLKAAGFRNIAEI
ncbi:hypothetical protein D3C71_157240 [compost metagenome]